MSALLQRQRVTADVRVMDERAGMLSGDWTERGFRFVRLYLLCSAVSVWLVGAAGVVWLHRDRPLFIAGTITMSVYVVHLLSSLKRTIERWVSDER